MPDGLKYQEHLSGVIFLSPARPIPRAREGAHCPFTVAHYHNYDKLLHRDSLAVNEGPAISPTTGGRPKNKSKATKAQMTVRLRPFPRAPETPRKPRLVKAASEKHAAQHNEKLRKNSLGNYKSEVTGFAQSRLP